MDKENKLHIKALLANRNYTAFWFASAFSMAASDNPPPLRTQEKKFRDELVQGLRTIWEHPFLRRFVRIGPSVNFFFASVFSVTITYLLLNVYQAGKTVFGIYRAVTASTAVLTPFLAVSVIKKKKNGRNFAGNDKNHRAFAFCHCRLCVAAKFSYSRKPFMGSHRYHRA